MNLVVSERDQGFGYGIPIIYPFRSEVDAHVNGPLFSENIAMCGMIGAGLDDSLASGRRAWHTWR